MSNLVTTKISTKSLQAVRVIAGFTGEKQFEVIERLLVAEMAKVLPKNREGIKSERNTQR